MIDIKYDRPRTGRERLNGRSSGWRKVSRVGSATKTREKSRYLLAPIDNELSYDLQPLDLMHAESPSSPYLKYLTIFWNLQHGIGKREEPG